MNPQHGVPEQNTTIPYQLIPEVESVSAGETVQLTLNKADAEAIRKKLEEAGAAAEVK